VITKHGRTEHALISIDISATGAPHDKEAGHFSVRNIAHDTFYASLVNVERWAKTM
jgi:hypothetical protein